MLETASRLSSIQWNQASSFLILRCLVWPGDVRLGIESLDPGESRYLVAIIIFAMESQPCVYMVTNRRNGTLYVGVTSCLPRRIWQHKNKVIPGFTEKYGLDRLVWYEVHETILSAIQREKVIKFWRRKWKLEVIEHENPEWLDLFEDIV